MTGRDDGFSEDGTHATHRAADDSTAADEGESYVPGGDGNPTTTRTHRVIPLERGPMTSYH